MKNIIKNPLQHRGLFLRIGFIAALILVMLAFQWNTDYQPADPGNQLSEDYITNMNPIRTKHEPKETPKPKQAEKKPQQERLTNKVEIVEEPTEPEMQNEPAPVSLEIDTSVYNQPGPVDDEIPEPRYRAEEMPHFPGGREALIQYIHENIEYPENERKMGIEGTVHVQFVVDQSGRVRNVEVKRGPTQAMRQEAKRVVKNLPKWEPGRVNGYPVPVYYTLPISFKQGR